MSKRTFIRNAKVSNVAFSGLTGIINLFASESELAKVLNLKGNFWFWGQNARSHHSTINPYNLSGKNFLEAREGNDFLSIEKCCRVAMNVGQFPPSDRETGKIKNWQIDYVKILSEKGRTCTFHNPRGIAKYHRLIIKWSL